MRSRGFWSRLDADVLMEGLMWMLGEMMFRCTDARLRLAVVWERGGSSISTSGQA